MSVGRDGPYNFVLQDSEDSPKISLGFVLADDETNDTLAWLEGRVPPIPPRRSSGPLDWSHNDPITDFVFAQSDWSKGAFVPYYDNSNLGHYAKSDGVDLRWEGVAALGPRRGDLRGSGAVNARIQSNLFFPNGDFEEGQNASWVAGTGSALTHNTSVVRTGNFSGQVVVDQGTAAGNVLTVAVPNPTIYRSREITVIAYTRRAAGSDSGLTMRITDSAGNTAQGQSAVTADSWTYVSATRTVDSGATSLAIEFYTSSALSTDEHTFRIDDVYLVPTGGVTCEGMAVRASTDPDEIYAAVGRCVLQWSETTYSWEAAYIDGSATATDIIEYDNNIYVAFGEPAGATPHQYIYGSGTSWTTAALNATTTHHDNHARFWVKARNGFGQYVLWKAGPSTNQGTERNAVAWANDPTSSWQPTDSYFEVGTKNREITKLYPFRDTFIVGKTNGLWLWEGSVNDFVIITEEWENSVDAANASVGHVWHNDLYVNAIRQGFFRYAGGDNVDDISELLMAPRLTDFGGRITAMTACARELIMGLDQPTADTTITKTSRLVKLRRAVDGTWELHTVQEPTIGLIDALSLHRDTRLWAIGRTYDSNLSDYVGRSNVWIEPTKVAAHYADTTPTIESTGTFDTSIWHGGLPEADKAFIALTIWCEDIDSNHTITVSYGRDGRAPNDTTLGIFNGTGRVQTLLFKRVVNPTVNAAGRFIQMRFTFSTTNTISPKLYAFALHTQLVPEPIRVFTLDAWVGGGTRMRTGVQHELSKSEIETAFRTLEAQIFPLTLVEDFGQSHGGEDGEGAHKRQVRLVNYQRLPEGSVDQGQERWRLTLQEVPAFIET